MNSKYETTNDVVISNAWSICLGEADKQEGFIVRLDVPFNLIQDIQDGDFIMCFHEKVPNYLIAFARVYRLRPDFEETLLLLDCYIRPDANTSLTIVGLNPLDYSKKITRMEFSLFENVLKQSCNINLEDLPQIDGKSKEGQAYIRDLLQFAMMDDLLGPAGGPLEQITGMSVRDRYLVGKLAPRDLAQGNSIEFGTDTDEESAKDQSNLAVYANENHTTTSRRSGYDLAEEDETEPLDNSANKGVVPSSIGLTFCIDKSSEKLSVAVQWGRYESLGSVLNEDTGKKERCWQRIPSGGQLEISLNKKDIGPLSIDPESEEVVLHGSVSDPLDSGERLVTLFLLNSQKKPDKNQDTAWVFQPQIIIRDASSKPIFCKRPKEFSLEHDEELAALEMIYREKAEFAVGHGVSVHAIPSTDDCERAIEIQSRIIPFYEVPTTEVPGRQPEDRTALKDIISNGLLDMNRLANMTRDDLITTLRKLNNDYIAWIQEQRERIGENVNGFDNLANESLDRCAEISIRLQEGIEVLENNDDALEAFRFTNYAMALQRVHSIYSLKKRRNENVELKNIDKPENHSWRPFQLAFILLSIPALTDPSHKDRTEPIDAYADLLWFPTGGGKTEAYLGVAAFAMSIRRLQSGLGGLDSSRGLAVIMRYTLRLLTIQQFQRATTLICAMEVIRRNDIEKWGTEPFTIGLWVGKKTTPNTVEESSDSIEREKENRLGSGSTPAQLTYCPWCGAEIKPGRDIKVDKVSGRTIIYCGETRGKCDFSQMHTNTQGLPVIVIDEEIYHHPPAILIATVDKFTQMAWKGEVRTLFGKATQECQRHGLLWPNSNCSGTHRAQSGYPPTTVKDITPIRPPDLIIQDEFHLISGPLGTMVGLYETAVDELSSWDFNGKTVKPKIIASTATVRKANNQINNVFLRRAAIFPPHGLDVEDNFFSVQRSVKEISGRKYIGICSPGSSRPAVLIRVYVALLTASKELFDRFGSAADPYMTLVGYFNSLRELGGMRRLAEDDVQTRSYRVEMGSVNRPGLKQRAVRVVDELTARVSNKDIPKKLDQLEIPYKQEWSKDELRAIDIVLASNMLSVGVDVNRLGLMVVNGQPKNTAEYIQATSRVGRAFPGLVCTVLAWSRPRDLSHYETFEHYHATFYKHVEAQSVTPFAPRALDRGLTGITVSMLRLNNVLYNPNLGAQELNNSGSTEANKTRLTISDRAWKVRNEREAKNLTEAMVAERIDLWVKEAIKPGRRLGYESQRGDVVALLKKPGPIAWDEFTVPMSMREVEPGVRLIIDDSKNDYQPEWKTKPVQNDGGNI